MHTKLNNAQFAQDALPKETVKWEASDTTMALQCTTSAAIGLVGISVVRQQKFHHFDEAPARGTVQRRRSILVANVHVAPVLQQNFGDLK